MDDRRQQLTAAANALIVWVRAQQAARDTAIAPVITPLHTPAMAPMAAAAIPLHEFDTLSGELAEQALADPAPARRSFDLAARLVPVIRAAASMPARLAPPLLRVWKPVVASIAVMALIGVARSSWPQWSAALKTRLSDAGKHVTVFDRPPAPAEQPAEAPKAVATATAGRRTGQLHVLSNPVGARVSIDGRDRGVTPITINDVAAGTHVVALKSDAGTIQRSVTVSADKTTEVNEAIFSGWLHVSSPVELTLSEGTQGLRLDDSNQLLLAPGVHDLRFESKRFAFSERRTVEIRPGGTTSVTVEPPPSKLSVVASTPAEVLIDGTLVGGTPLTDFAVAVGTREIVVRNAAGEERRQTLTVTVAPISLEIDFSR